MKKISPFQIICFILFVSFMFVSCWATVSSLNMSVNNNDIPKFAFWIVTIGVFVLSSIGVKLISDSFNQKIQVNYRGWKLIGGIVMLLLFWIMFSMPTNTHTFFYMVKVRPVVRGDIKQTEYYLQQLANNTKAEDTIKAEQHIFEQKVWDAFGKFKEEIENNINKGYGPEAKKRLAELNAVLEGEPIAILSGDFTSAIKRQLLIQQYQTIVSQKVEERKRQIAHTLTPGDAVTYMAEAAAALNDLQNAETKIDNYRKEGKIIPSADLRNQIEPIINNGYKVISSNRKHVDFVKDASGNYIDRDVYTEKRANNGEVIETETKTLRMFSVLSVWADYFKGKYKGLGFFYWIIASIIVDVAGFIFFAFTFKDTELFNRKN